MPEKILVVRFSSIGDIVLTTPVVRSLKLQLNAAEVHYITKEAFAPQLRSNPYISKVFTIKSKVSEVINELKAENYDFVIDLHNNLRSWQVLMALRKPYGRFRKLNIRKWLLVRLGIDLMPQVHIVDRYMLAASRLNIKNDGKGLDFFIPEEQEVPLNVLPEEFRDGYVGLVTGGKHNTKILPAEKIAEICSLLDLPVVLLGGPEDNSRAEEVCSLAGLKAYNACGRFNLLQSASLVRQAKFIITNDTGLMHIAAAFKKPVVSVWGNTVPQLGMYPYLPVDVPALISEVKGLSCRPCSKIGFDKCPKGHFKCMMNQDSQRIAEFVNLNSKI